MLTSQYLKLMDKANQAIDRQTYFFYIRQAEQLLREDATANESQRISHDFNSKSVCLNAA